MRWSIAFMTNCARFSDWLLARNQPPRHAWLRVEAKRQNHDFQDLEICPSHGGELKISFIGVFHPFYAIEPFATIHLDTINLVYKYGGIIDVTCSA